MITARHQNLHHRIGWLRLLLRLWLLVWLIVVAPITTIVYADDSWLQIDHRIRLGMPGDELSSLLVGYESDKQSYGDNTQCYYLLAKEEQLGLYYMIVEGKLVRIDIDHSELGLQTPAGIGIGSKAAAVRAAYPDITESPHPYLGDIGSYMAVSIDQGSGIIFETAEDVVTNFRYGQSSALNYIEGCL